MSAKKRVVASAFALALATLTGCGPDADGRGAPAAAGAAPPTYRLGVIQSHAVVVVLQSTGPADAVGRAVELALRRVGTGGPGAGTVLEDADVVRIAGGRLLPYRTAEPPPPLGDCVAVTPLSGADGFVGVAYADRAEPDVRFTQIVLRYPDVAAAAEGAARVRRQFEDCPDAGQRVQVRTREQHLADGAGEVFVGVRVGSAA